MKQITLQIPDKKYSFFMELIKNLDFVKKIEEDHEPSKEEILDGLREAVKELNLIKAGKKKARNAEEFLNEL